MITAHVAPSRPRGLPAFFLKTGIIDSVVALSDLRLLRWLWLCKSEICSPLPEDGSDGGHSPHCSLKTEGLLPDLKTVTMNRCCAFGRSSGQRSGIVGMLMS